MDQVLVNAILLGMAVALLSHWLWQRRVLYKFAYRFPLTLWGLPFIGCGLSIGNAKNLLQFLHRQWKCYEERSFIGFLMATPIICTADPEVIRQILTQTEFNEKARKLYDPMVEVTCGGMLALTVEKSLRQRKQLASSFRPKKLLNFMDTFNMKAIELVQQFNQICENGGDANDLLNILRINAINVTKLTTMGPPEMFDRKDDKSKMHRRYSYIFHHTLWEMVLNCANLRWLIKYNPLFTYLKREMHNISEKIIAHRINTAHSNEAALPSEEYLIIDVAYRYFKTGETTMQAFIGEIDELLMASYETSATTLYSAMVMLAMHSGIQERLYEEIISVYSNKDAHVEYEHFAHLKYLHMFINEVLRLFPPVPIIGREAVAGSALKIAGTWYKLPKNMQIVIDIMGLHRDTKIWGPNANIFDPDNFLPHNIAERNSYAFIPFSKGARICFGWTYAYMVLKVMIIHIVRNFRLSTTFKYEDIQLQMHLFLIYSRKPLLQLDRRT